MGNELVIALDFHTKINAPTEFLECIRACLNYSNKRKHWTLPRYQRLGQIKFTMCKVVFIHNNMNVLLLNLDLWSPNKILLGNVYK